MASFIAELSMANEVCIIALKVFSCLNLKLLDIFLLFSQPFNEMLRYDMFICIHECPNTTTTFALLQK